MGAVICILTAEMSPVFVLNQHAVDNFEELVQIGLFGYYGAVLGYGGSKGGV